jgi:hypothetical protein
MAAARIGSSRCIHVVVKLVPVAALTGHAAEHHLQPSGMKPPLEPIDLALLTRKTSAIA